LVALPVSNPHDNKKDDTADPWGTIACRNCPRPLGTRPTRQRRHRSLIRPTARPPRRAALAAAAESATIRHAALGPPPPPAAPAAPPLGYAGRPGHPARGRHGRLPPHRGRPLVA